MAVRPLSWIIHKCLPPKEDAQFLTVTRAKAALKVSKDPKEVLAAVPILERSGKTRAINALGAYGYRISWANRALKQSREAAIEADLLKNIANDDPYVVLTCLKGFLQHYPTTEHPYSKMLNNAIGSLSSNRKAAVLVEHARTNIFSTCELFSILKLDDLEKLNEVFNATPAQRRRSIFANEVVYRNVLSWLNKNVCPELWVYSNKENSPHDENIAKFAPLINFVFQHGHPFAVRYQHHDFASGLRITSQGVSCVKVLEGLTERVPLVITIFRAGPFPQELVPKIEDRALINLGAQGIDYFAEMASRHPDQIFQTVKRILETCQKYVEQNYVPERRIRGKFISQVVTRFNDEMIWTLVIDFYNSDQRLCKEVLAGIEPLKADRILRAYGGQEWIDKLWDLLTPLVQATLRSRGSAPSGARGARQGSDNRQRQEGPRADNRQGRQDYQNRGRPRAGNDPMSILINKFGFREDMTYAEAKKLFLELALKKHPDFKQKKGMTEIRLLEQDELAILNAAWTAAKDRFRKS